MKCRICEAALLPIGTALVLKKHNVSFRRCTACGFVQTEEPYWLAEAYQDPIPSNDLGYADRNWMYSRVVSTIIRMFFDPNGRFLDYGAGYGLFVRLMRDKGFDFYWSDRYAKNLFAKGLEASDRLLGSCEIVTAIEVAEHFPNPIEEFRLALRYSRSILFTTTLISDPPPPLDAWDYYSLDTGQHVSFYTMQSLRVLASSLGLRLYSNRSWMHLLTPKRIPEIVFNILSRCPVAGCIDTVLPRRPPLKP